MNTNACPKFASLYFEYSVSTRLKLISICVLAGVFHPISLLLSKCIKTYNLQCFSFSFVCFILLLLLLFH